MAKTLPIQANTDVLGFYHRQKSEFHFQEKTDNEFLMFLLDTAVRVISIVQHLAPVIEAVSEASAHADDAETTEEANDSFASLAEFTNRSMEVDRAINKEVDDIIQLQPITTPPPKTLPPQVSKQKAPIPPTSIQPQQHPTPQPQASQQVGYTTTYRAAPTTAQFPPANTSSVVPVQIPRAPQTSFQTSSPAVVQHTNYHSAVQTVPNATPIVSTSTPIAVSIPDNTPAAQPTPAPQSTPQATSSVDTGPEPAYQYPSQPADMSTEEIKAEGVPPEVVTIKDEVVEPMQTASSLEPLLPQDTINQLMNSITQNEENVGIANLVTTAQPSSLSSTFLDKSNNPLSMLSLSNTASNLNNLMSGSLPESLPGSSRGGELKSLMDGKPGSSGTSNPILCPVCLRSFSHQVSVQRHIKAVHLKLKPHACSLCPRSFSRGEELRNHRFKIHGVKELPVNRGVARDKFRNDTSI